MDNDTIKAKSANIGQRLIDFRKLHQLNQKEFADRIMTTQASISQIESGKSIPDGSTFIKLIDAFPMINLHWLFLGQEEPLKGNNKAMNNYYKVILELKKGE